MAVFLTLLSTTTREIPTLLYTFMKKGTPFRRSISHLRIRHIGSNLPGDPPRMKTEYINKIIIDPATVILL